MLCLEADTVAKLFSERLSADERQAIDVHVDRCATCRQLIAAVARGAVTDGDPVPEAGAAGADPGTRHVVLHSGDLIARYVIERFLGAGAMGAVYEARDPELGRRVALKVVPARPAANDEARVGRLVREAQAMARLSHPNIVPVYDAGRSGDVVFIAMQRVEGVSLREHVAQGRWSMAARLRLVCAAGRGLAAAHDAGIVHRDLKPDNILIDARGSALVGDFGLARVPEDAEADASGGPAGDPWCTADGAIVGTPAYMAPEVKRGGRGDALADQFSFAVTLAEVLGVRVGDDRALQTLPRRIRRVVKRALADDPRRRFPSMSALLAALEPRLTRARVAVAVGAIAATIAVVAVWPRPGADPVAACRRAAEDRLRGEWNAETRRTIETHLVGLPAPGGAAISTASLGRVDRYATAWLAMRRDVCEATRVRGEQSATLSDLRMTCLDERLVELGVVRRTLESLTAPELANAPGLADLVGDLSQCADARSLERRAPSDPIALATTRTLSRELAEANATILRGRLAEATGGMAEGYAAAEQATDRVLASARAARLPVIEAQALRIRTHLLGRGTGRGDPAGFYQALAIGDRLGDPAIRVDALVGLLGGAVADVARTGEVVLLARLLDAALVELPGAQHARHARLAGNLAVFHRNRGELPLAEQHAREAVQHLDAEGGRGDLYRLNGHRILAGILLERGRVDEAQQLHAEALAAMRETYGERHPLIVAAYLEQGTNLAKVAQHAAARAAYEQALALAEDIHGAEHVQVAQVLRKLGFLALDEDPPTARPAFARAIAILEHHGKHVQLGPLLVGLGQAELAAGDVPAAIRSLERGLMLLAVRPSDSHLVPPARFALARALWQGGGDRARARALATEALDQYRTAHGAWPIVEVTAEVSAWLEAHR